MFIRVQVLKVKSVLVKIRKDPNYTSLKGNLYYIFVRLVGLYTIYTYHIKTVK